MYSYEETLDYLAEVAGILPECLTDVGVLKTTRETKQVILKSLGLPADTLEEAQQSLEKLHETNFRRALPPVAVERKSNRFADLYVVLPSVTAFDSVLTVTIDLESGTTRKINVPYEETREGERAKIDGVVMEQRWFTFELPEEYGYHVLTVDGVDGLPENGRQMTLVVVPDKCYCPEFVSQDNRPWGFPAQLYALSSQKSWGIGDFSSLKVLMNTAGKLGASLVGINPVNTLFNSSALSISPYYSTSRLFLNTLYISIEDVEGFTDCAAVQKYVSSAAFKKKLAAARKSKTVDYATVQELKQKALHLLFDDFLKNHMALKTKTYLEFKDFSLDQGDDLYFLAIYQALSDFYTKKGVKGGFLSWDEKYHNPHNEAVTEFAEKHTEEVMFYMYVQWLAAKQFKDAAQNKEDAGLNIGLYQDLAVGVATESAETWAHADVFLKRLSVGSPPDMFNAFGQKWGVAAMNPQKMREESYAFYRKILSMNMKTAGALRIDHVMGLARLYLIPDGLPGAYLKYPFEELTGIVALESWRHKCMVIGEDLGVVPSFFRESMAAAGMLSFKIFRYQRGENGAFMAPESYPEIALTAAGTHDMPTLCGFWTGEDIDTGVRLGLISDEQAAKQARLAERRDMVWSFAKSGRWFVDSDSFEQEITGKKIPEKLTLTVYRYLASAPSLLFLAQLEDILNQTEQMNFPGTVDQYPNWQYKLSVAAEDLADDERVREICAVIREQRNKKKGRL